MEDGSFSFPCAPLQRYEKDVVMKGAQDHLFGVKDWRDGFISWFRICSLSRERGRERSPFVQRSTTKVAATTTTHFKLLCHCVPSNDFQFHSVSSPPIQSIQESLKLKSIQTETSDFVQPNKQRSYQFSSTCLQILSNYVSGLKKMKGENMSNISTADQTDMGGQKISTEEIMRVAGAKYINFSAQGDADNTMVRYPFGFPLLNLSEEETLDVKLVQFLLAAAEKVVLLFDMKDVKEEQFEIEEDEVVVVYSTFVLRTMISRPSCLDNLMGVIKKLNPSMMVVTEIEANHNSLSFVNRFIEMLFFYSAFFDCLEASMDRNDQNRMIIEAILGEGIRNMAAAEGKMRAVRNVKIDVWRAFFARFGMVETEFSESSLYQASLVVKQSVGGNFCTLDTNGKSLIVGWKGTPINSLSVWKLC